MFSFRRKMFNGFTLVELLIVMGIIMLLTAILFPAISGAKKSAMISKAQAEIKMLHTAIQSFRNEYDRYPLHGTKYRDATSDIEYDNSELISTLRGNQKTAGVTDNPRLISFIKINEASLDESGQFVDPWDRKNSTFGTPYNAYVDANFDGKIDVDINKGNVNIQVVTNAPIAVWSMGNPKDDDVGPYTSWGGEYVERAKK